MGAKNKYVFIRDKTLGIGSDLINGVQGDYTTIMLIF